MYNNEIKVLDIEVGQTFFYCGTEYLKLKQGRFDSNYIDCININVMVTSEFQRDTLVTPAKMLAELLVDMAHE